MHSVALISFEHVLKNVNCSDRWKNKEIESFKRFNFSSACFWTELMITLQKIYEYINSSIFLSSCTLLSLEDIFEIIKEQLSRIFFVYNEKLHSTFADRFKIFMIQTKKLIPSNNFQILVIIRKFIVKWFDNRRFVNQIKLLFTWKRRKITSSGLFEGSRYLHKIDFIAVIKSMPKANLIREDCASNHLRKRCHCRHCAFYKRHIVNT